MTHQNLGKILKQKRVQKGFTQEELGFIIGNVHSQYVSNWERGICAPPENKKSSLTKILNLDKKEIEKALKKDLKKTVKDQIETIWKLK